MIKECQIFHTQKLLNSWSILLEIKREKKEQKYQRMCSLTLARK
ncbi:hypothetical protein BN389_06080 [Listeria monocytogenes serotype 4b str. LL195]|nr:hypothetical protein BN389_06080 [Listeria monocytogenes serotype 4b str. LL195]